MQLASILSIVPMINLKDRKAGLKNKIRSCNYDGEESSWSDEHSGYHVYEDEKDMSEKDKSEEEETLDTT